MIKEQDQPENSNQLWTFNDAGCTFFVKKNKNLFKFKLNNVFTNHWHQSQDIELQRINEQTIKAAFDPKVESVSCIFFSSQDELTQKSQKSINLQFRVKIEYLATNFSEDIELKQVEMDKKQELRIQTEQILNEVQKIEVLIEKELENNIKTYFNEITGQNTRMGRMFAMNLPRGKYFCSIVGAYISEKVYNGEYYDDMYGGYDNNLSSIPCRLRVKMGENLLMELISTVPNYRDGYEYPYAFAGIFEVKSEGKEDKEVTFNMESTNPNEVLMFNNNLLVVNAISQFNDMA